MKNKKIIALTTSILLLFVFGSFLLPVVKADIETYEQRTDPLNPFLFSVDMIYITSDGALHYTDIQYFYHQVFLECDKQYIFYDPCGYMSSEDTRLWIHSAISTSIDYYYEYVSEDKIGYILYINPSETGLYNITIRFGVADRSGACGFSGIGVLEIPIVPLGTEIKNDWDFCGDPIMAGMYKLESQTEYRTGYIDKEYHDYSNLNIYYANINSFGKYEKLDYSHNTMDYGAYDIITINSLGQGEGNYLFYAGGHSFSLMEVEAETILTWDWLIFIVILIAIIGVIIVSYIVFKKKHPKEPIIQEKEVK